ncbi:hypothetical protein GCM10010339_04280 [Streptomyces alanosinicus]|uniref:Uncharacterized protein n=1 Tax=Streptomyces alanosinicus TaxID=68171 RepID=A0A918YCD6_9ACTN|nr:hypothetical protein GCM10010339_04280 [Streptomyces alanosinicus]
MRIVDAGPIEKFPQSAPPGKGEQVEQRAAHAGTLEGKPSEFFRDAAQCRAERIRISGGHRVIESLEKGPSGIL